MSEIIEGKPQLAPGFCFICELSNPVRYIDTFRDFQGVVHERLDGRKYLCEECVEDAAKKLGFVSPKEADELKSKISVQTKFIGELRDDLQKLEDLKAIVEHFGSATVTVANAKSDGTKVIRAKKAA